MAESTKHNGWTNYATWRVNLEFFDNYQEMYWEDEIENFDTNNEKDSIIRQISSQLKTDIENYITERSRGLAQDYALAFLKDVNYWEIAEHIYDNYLIEQE